jgi:hypothetical protein
MRGRKTIYPITLTDERKLLPGQPLALVNHKANQVIDETSDEEAYVWLDLMIRNIERADGKVEEY